MCYPCARSTCYQCSRSVPPGPLPTTWRGGVAPGPGPMHGPGPPMVPPLCRGTVSCLPWSWLRGRQEGDEQGTTASVNGRTWAERVGFEPTVPCGTRALQARRIGHSRTSPRGRSASEYSKPDPTPGPFPGREGESMSQPAAPLHMWSGSGRLRLDHEVAAVDVERRTGDVGGAVGGEERDQLGDFLR